MKNTILLCLFFAVILLSAAPKIINDVENWTPMQNLADGTSEAVIVDEKPAIRITTTADNQKSYLSNDKAIVAAPGSKWVLRFKAKSDIERKSGVRAGISFFTADGKRAPIKNYMMTTYCGGSTEWKEYTHRFTMPEGADNFKVIASIYIAKGTAVFTDFSLVNEKGEAIELPNADGSKKKVAQPAPAKKTSAKTKAAPEDPVPEDAAWSYKFVCDGVPNNLHVTGLTLDAELVQYDGPHSLRFLTGQGTAKSNKAMPGVTLCSSHGTAYWQLCNMTTLEQVFAWSDEKIPLEGDLKPVSFKIPFTGHNRGWQSDFSKGAYVCRGHHYFQMYKDGKRIGSASSLIRDAQISPEAAFFGTGRTGNFQPLKASSFTLADLAKCSVKIAEFRSSGKANGDFAFRLELTDTAGECFAVNRVHTLEVMGDDGKTLECEPQFDRYAIPTGWFVGKYAGTLPKTLSVKATMRASTASGIRTVVADGNFATKASKEPVYSPDKEPFCIKPNEVRAVTFHVQYLPKDETAGRSAIKEIMAQMKKANMNELYCFAISNRAYRASFTDNPFHTRIMSWDSLAVFREETRKAGMKFNVFVCLLPEGSEKPRGFLEKHPEYAMRRGNGVLAGWMDPAVPEVREYRIRDIVAVAKKYEVDMVELDYARLADGPSDRGAELYMKEFGKDPRTFKSDSDDYKHWYAWTSSFLVQWVRELREALRKEAPGVKLSAYVQGYRQNGPQLWQEQHQPFGKWLDEGLLDRVVPTGYVYDMLRYKCWVKRQIDYCHAHNPKTQVLIEIGAKTSHGAIKDLKEFTDQLDEATRLGAEGTCVFQWMGFSPFIDGLSKTRFANSVMTK